MAPTLNNTYVLVPLAVSSGPRIVSPTVTESVVESANSVVEFFDSMTDSTVNSLKNGVWVWAFSTETNDIHVHKNT